MKFKRTDDHHARSTCGRYSLVPYDAPDGSGCVTAWRAREDKRSWPRIVKTFYWQSRAGREPAIREAMRACEADAGVSA